MAVDSPGATPQLRPIFFSCARVDVFVGVGGSMTPSLISYAVFLFFFPVFFFFFFFHSPPFSKASLDRHDRHFSVGVCIYDRRAI